ncbi:MAG: trypsin-like peptidase domain-containing protein [Thermoleophilia bacterium]|nr:trypsin-like peptidase domain-containing protein [Thermoleophilia bacterium]
MSEYAASSPPEPPQRPRRHGLRLLAGRAAPLLGASLLGAAVAVGIVAATELGGGSATTTVVERAAGETAPAAFEPSESSLSTGAIYERAAPGVVRITATSTEGTADPFDFGLPQQQEALGSGFVIDKAGHIVTNYHVVEGAQEFHVGFSGQDPVLATLVGVDPSTDLAVLKVDAPARALIPLPLGDSDEVSVGDSVVAIGNPFGLDRTITAGIVSAVQRGITAPNGFRIDHVIQTDAAINHGNSGGPLLNARGEVIGVNAQILGAGGEGNVGVGFAIPVNTVKEVASELIESGQVEHAYLGIEMQPITAELARTFRLPVDEGVLIANVRPESPAEAAGLRGGDTAVTLNGSDYTLGGDIITAIDGEPVTTMEQVRDAVTSKEPGDTVTIEVNRDGETMTLTATLGSQPATPTG